MKDPHFKMKAQRIEPDIKADCGSAHTGYIKLCRDFRRPSLPLRDWRRGGGASRAGNL